ncbi:hypothetical protein [Streptomyces sp. NPDC055105]|uniref:hypothetical protein n=1 Tax=Streptomyces sp. NPDC055105 TaxID=3365719 RepID=UPI0037D643E9
MVIELKQWTGVRTSPFRPGMARIGRRTVQHPARQERLAAQHIKDAYNTPSATKPANTNKEIPGRTADRPLTRLYAKP